MKYSEKVSEKVLQAILTDFDKGIIISEILKKNNVSKNILFKILKENGKHRLDTGISSYKKELEIKAKVYWKIQGIEPPKNSLIGLLEPEFGEEMARKLIDVFAFLKNKSKLKKILESEIL